MACPALAGSLPRDLWHLDLAAVRGASIYEARLEQTGNSLVLLLFPLLPSIAGALLLFIR